MTDERDPERDRPESEPAPPSSEEDARDANGLDDVDLRDLLRGALRPPKGSVAPRLLPGVQRKLRARSRGKFYGDGWSTAQTPRLTYLVTSLIMLALVAVVFLVLVPWSSGAAFH